MILIWACNIATVRTCHWNIMLKPIWSFSCFINGKIANMGQLHRRWNVSYYIYQDLWHIYIFTHAYNVWWEVFCHYAILFYLYYSKSLLHACIQMLFQGKWWMGNTCSSNHTIGEWFKVVHIYSIKWNGKHYCVYIHLSYGNKWGEIEIKNWKTV